jgi:hypothetical protein
VFGVPPLSGYLPGNMMNEPKRYRPLFSRSRDSLSECWIRLLARASSEGVASGSAIGDVVAPITLAAGQARNRWTPENVDDDPRRHAGLRITLFDVSQSAMKGIGGSNRAMKSRSPVAATGHWGVCFALGTIVDRPALV